MSRKTKKKRLEKKHRRVIRLAEAHRQLDMSKLYLLHSRIGDIPKKIVMDNFIIPIALKHKVVPNVLYERFIQYGGIRFVLEEEKMPGGDKLNYYYVDY